MFGKVRWGATKRDNDEGEWGIGGERPSSLYESSGGNEK